MNMGNKDKKTKENKRNNGGNGMGETEAGKNKRKG